MEVLERFGLLRRELAELSIHRAGLQMLRIQIGPGSDGLCVGSPRPRGR